MDEQRINQDIKALELLTLQELRSLLVGNIIEYFRPDYNSQRITDIKIGKFGVILMNENWKALFDNQIIEGLIRRGSYTRMGAKYKLIKTRI